MLHVTIIILVCFTVSASSEGIAVARRKNYLYKGFCLFEDRVPKATEISSSSIDNVDEEQFSDCVKHKITYRLSFFNNFFINQYRDRKNNYCSIMNSVLRTKKRDSSSSAELTYRKRNLLWTRKGLESIKTLKPTEEPPSTTTTPKPFNDHTLNYIEKKRFFAIKKTKTQKRKRVRRCNFRRHSVGKSKNLRKQITFSGPDHQISEVIWDDDNFVEKPRGFSQAFPRFQYLEKFIGLKKNCRNRGPVSKQSLRDQEFAAGKATEISYNVPQFRHSRNYVSKKHKKNARLFHVKNFHKENRLLSSDPNGMNDFWPLRRNDMFTKGRKSKKLRRRLGRFQNQVKSLPLRKNCTSNLNHRVYDPRLKGNDEINAENNNELNLLTDRIGSNELGGIEETRHSNKQEKKDYGIESDRSEYHQNTKSAFPDYVNDEKHFKTKQEMSEFLREILKASADYFADLNEGFNSLEEPNEFCAPESTITKPFLSRSKLNKEVSAEDFDFPDYDEIYDPAANCFLKNYTPFHFRDRRKFKHRNNVLPKKKYWKTHLKQRSDSNCQTPLNFKRSLLFKKLERKKKFCGSRCSKSCGVPHKCWKSAPLLCIPYIRKSQDDLLKYLIRVMQNMLGKPYPQKLDIFENTKYKPSVKKCPQTTCEDIIPHDPEDEDDDDDEEENCDTKNPCKPCPQCPSSPAPCPPKACPPVPTPCSSCPKGCTKNSNEASCPSFPCSLPNVNQIYTESATCASDKCYSTLPPFLLPLSSIIQSGSKKDPSKKADFDFASVKPTASTVKSLGSISNKNAKVLNDSESFTFFPPKKFAPEYFKKAKEVSHDSLADDNQLHSDQRLNEKILPELVDYQEEMNLLNLTDNMSESTLKPSTGDEPFLFELPKFFGDEKHATDLSNANMNNSFARRDLNVVHEYDDEIFRSKNPTDISPKRGTQIIHRIPSKQKRVNTKNYYKILPVSEDNTYQSFPVILPQLYDEPQIDKPLYLRRRNRKHFKYKNRKSLKRQKRQYDYDVDDSVNYDDYLFDTNDNKDYEERSHQQLKKEALNSNVNRLVDDYGWTPIQFEMFNELAKLVTGMETKDVSSLEPVSATTHTTTSATDSTVRLPSTTGYQLKTTSIKLITEKSSTSAPTKEVYTMKNTSSATTQEYDTTSESKQTRVDDETRSSIKISSTTESREVNSEKQGKSVGPLDLSTYADTEDGQVVTTVGSAIIAKGPKKQMTKPSPKIYTRVYPDSVPIENGKNETTIATSTDSASTRNISLRTTTAMTSVTPDVRLQLLAVCEGYLEVLKLIKSQNQSFAGDLDSDLSSYCENIISQSLSQQTESPKSKKQELNSPAKAGNDTLQNAPKKVANLIPESQLDSSSRLGDNILKRELDGKKIEAEKLIHAGGNGNTESPPWKNKQNVKKKRRKKEYQRDNQKIPEADDEFLKRGMTEEQVELLRLLKKRKKALLNWLFNSKEDQVQPEVEETEYFDDNDESNANFLNLGNSSGTVRPRGAKSSGETDKAGGVITNDSVIPVYAKEYGYDKGGQLKQVEVLWRKVNDQTNEKQTYKNLSVLALVLTSTVAPRIFKKNNIFDINGYVNEDVSAIRAKTKTKVGSVAEKPKINYNNSDVEKTQGDTKTTPFSNFSDSTVTFTTKPNPSSSIGTEMINFTNTTSRPNITQNIAGKLNKAKGVVEEYTIEFWNYAVYILPIMFSILFLFCCVCCAIHILRTNKKSKKKKKKKKQFESTEEEASSEETDSEPKKKRRDRFKKSKNIWKVWKKNANDEANLPEKNKSFLKFLKSKKNDKAEEGSSVPYSELPEPSTKADNNSEAAERRELIALLEELKKIEMEQVGEKKEQKSVEVQYMIQDHEEPVFKRPEIFKGHPFYCKNRRFHEPVAEEFGIYRDGELNELLPCECGYYSKKRDYLRNYGFREKEEDRCERLFNLFRNAGVCHHQSEKKKKFTDKDKNFSLDRYRNADINDEKNEAGFTVKVCDMSEFKLSNPNDWVGEMEHFNNQVTKKKHVRLKDDGVLCRM